MLELNSKGCLLAGFSLAWKGQHFVLLDETHPYYGG